MSTSKFDEKYGSICGQIWVLDHDSQLAPLRADSSFGDCRRMSEPGVVKGFEQPFTIKNQNNYAIEQENVRYG